MSVFSTILAPLIVLGIGAVVFYISDHLLRPQDKGQVETLVIALATISLLPGLAHLNQVIHLNPLSQFTLYADKPTWMLAMILLIGALALSLACWNQPTQGRTSRLMALSSVLLLILSADQTLTVIAWTLADVAMLHMLGQQHAADERVIRAGFLSMLGAALLATGLMLQSSVEEVMFKTAAAIMLPWAFVLGLLPLPLPTWPTAANASSQTPLASQIMVFLLPSTIALALGQKFFTWDVALFNGWQQLWFVLWAMVIMLIGALRAWAAQTPAQLIDNTVWHGMGIILSTWALQLDPAVQLAAGINAILSVLILRTTWSQCQYLNVADPHTWWRALPVAFALGTQAGLPLTLGFPVRIAIYTTIFNSKWPALLPLIAAEALFMGALLRILLDLEHVLEPAGDHDAPEPENHVGSSQFKVPEAWLKQLAAHPHVVRSLDALLERIGNRWQPVLRLLTSIDPIYTAGALLSIFLFVLGLFPNLLNHTRSLSSLFRWLSIPRMPEWAALLLPLVGGIVAYRHQMTLIELVQGWWPLLDHLFDLDWLYRAVQKVLSLLRGLLWSATLVVEGAGYMAWVVLVCLVILIFVISR